MRWLFLLMIFLFRLSAFAQQDESISKDIVSIRQFTSDHRRLLLDKFYATRLDTVALILDSLDHHYPAQSLLLPAERMLLYYWIERYDDIKSLARNFERINARKSTDAIHDQAVWNVLSYHSDENLKMLVSWIEQSAYSDAESDFLVLLLKTLLNHDIENPLSLTSKIRSLVKQYDDREKELMPETPTFMSKLFSSHYYENAPLWGKFGIGGGFGFGTGFLTGRIADYYSAKNGVLLFINAKYERVQLLLFAQGGKALIKREMPFKNSKGSWDVGDAARYISMGYLAGFSVVDNRVIRLTPFIGRSLNKCYPSENYILKDEGSSNKYTMSYMLDLDIKFYRFLPELMEHGRKFPSFLIRLSYLPKMHNEVGILHSGGMFHISFSLNITTSKW